jgi:hypothetical protein
MGGDMPTDLFASFLEVVGQIIIWFMTLAEWLQ